MLMIPVTHEIYIRLRDKNLIDKEICYIEVSQEDMDKFFNMIKEPENNRTRDYIRMLEKKF